MGANVSFEKKSIIFNNKGLSTIEAIPLLIVFVVLLFFTFGFFGIVHSAVLHNIAARNYAFETFRHRSDLTYFRSNRMVSADLQHYLNTHSRLHGVISDTVGINSRQTATERPIALGLSIDVQNREVSVHNSQIFSLGNNQRNTGLGVSPVWIMVNYGICLKTSCGGE